MIAIDYLELIEQGVDAWNRWRLEHPHECPDLESAYLFEKSLPGINLSHTNLKRACLIGADLSGANLDGAFLQGVYANNANFQGASLVAADLQDGNFIEANLAQANLSEVVMGNANFTHACLQDTCLEGWPLDGGNKPEALTTPTVVPVAQGPSEPAGTLPKSWKLWPTVPLALGGITLTTTAFYLITRPRTPPLVTPDGVVTIQLVCNEPDTPLLKADEPDHTYQNGTRFYGDFADGQPADGRGSMLYSNGNRYDGEYQAGTRHGCGTFIFDNGRRYVGQFRNDLFSGRGVWMLENGDRYIGDFEFNKCNGEGVFIFADGTSKSGLWQQGRLVNSDLTCDSSGAELSVR